MNTNEEQIISDLETIISKAKNINEMDPALGNILLSFTKFSMDLYEAMAKGELYLVNEIVRFLASIQNINTNNLLTESYPKDRDDALPTADEDLTKFIMAAGNQYQPEIDAYKDEVAALVKDFKATVAQIRG